MDMGNPVVEKLRKSLPLCGFPPEHCILSRVLEPRLGEIGRPGDQTALSQN